MTMNPHSIVFEPKEERLDGIKDTHGSRQSLNDFHDSILKHILSFLPTKFAVRTSVLSKRWQYMWTSLPNLQFRCRNVRQRDAFMDFMDKAFILHNLPKIHKFSLDFPVLGDVSRVVSDVSRIRMWISGAVSRNAQEFDILFDHEFAFLVDEEVKHVFPFSLFKCETMEILKLQVNFAVQLPSQIYLPRLKIMVLRNLAFKDYHPTNLLFASPALEKLKLENCKWEDHISALVISAPKLWKLKIIECNEELTEDLDSSSVTISAPQLKYLSYTGGLMKAYYFTHPTSIIKASLSVDDLIMDSQDMPYGHLEEVLRSFQLVTHLQLSYLYFEVLSNATVPIFENLTVLEIVDGPVDLSCVELEMILNNSARLKTLKFCEGFSLDSVTYNFDRLLNIMEYLPTTLKNIVIGNFSGCIKEVLAVQILLAQMTSLESLVIKISGSNVAQRKEIETVLSALSRVSKSCQISCELVL